MAGRSAAPRRRGGGLRQNLLLSLVSLIVFALLLELVSAATLAVTDVEWDLGLGSGQPHLVYDVVRQWKLRRSVPGPPVRTNSLGFRGAEPSAGKPTGRVRIVAIGDSITFGSYDCAGGYCGDDDTYPAQLQSALGSGVEVLNAGTEGYNSKKARQWFDDRFAALSPDIVIVMVGWNDVLESSSAARAQTQQSSPTDDSSAMGVVDDWLRHNSHIYRLAWYGGKYLARARSGATDGAPQAGRWSESAPSTITIAPETIRAYETNLRALIRRARDGGAHIAVMTLADALGQDAGSIASADADQVARYYHWPTASQIASEVTRYNDVIRSVAASEGALLIDFASIVEREGGVRLFRLPDVNHPVHAAEPRLAARIADALRAGGLVK